MSDLKEKRELSKVNQRKCKFCKCSNYVKPKCTIKGGSAIVQIQGQNLVEEKPEFTSAEKDQLKMPNVEQEDL